MIYHTYLPRSPLLHFVAFLWSSEGDNLPKAQVRLLPIGSMELVINLRSDAIALFDQLLFTTTLNFASLKIPRSSP